MLVLNNGELDEDTVAQFLKDYCYASSCSTSGFKDQAFLQTSALFTSTSTPRRARGHPHPLIISLLYRCILILPSFEWFVNCSIKLACPSCLNDKAFSNVCQLGSFDSIPTLLHWYSRLMQGSCVNLAMVKDGCSMIFVKEKIPMSKPRTSGSSVDAHLVELCVFLNS